MKFILLNLVMATVFFTTAKAQPTAGLMAYWRMDGNYVDASPNFINGTNSGSTATTNKIGNPNTAMAYANPGSSVVQYGSHPTNANLNFTTGNFTVDFSVYANSPFIHAGGLYDNCLNNSGYGVWFWNSSGFPQIQFNFKNGSVGTTNGAFPLGVWKHVACVRNGSVMRIYINGVLNVTGSVGTGTTSYPIGGYFGTMAYNGFSPPPYNGFNGKLDEFRIYNRALTAAEILILASTALPVKLSSFTALNSNNNVKLQWQTQYEENCKHYNIQRSTDGVNFTTIGKVASAGNSNTPLTYNYTDVLPASLLNTPTVFYRLEAVDIDELLSNSQVVAVDLKRKNIQLLVFPNPAKDVLQVQANNMSGQSILTITDASGRTLFTRDILLQQGSNSTPVNVSHFSSGIYYVRLSNGKEIYTREFAKD